MVSPMGSLLQFGRFPLDEVHVRLLASAPSVFILRWLVGTPRLCSVCTSLWYAHRPLGSAKHAVFSSLSSVIITRPCFHRGIGQNRISTELCLTTRSGWCCSSSATTLRGRQCSAEKAEGPKVGLWFRWGVRVFSVGF